MIKCTDFREANIIVGETCYNEEDKTYEGLFKYFITHPTNPKIVGCFCSTCKKIAPQLTKEHWKVVS